MAKPTITFRSDTDPYPLTYDELDTNFLNLRDSTINFTGDAGDTRSMDLNDATAITGERNIKVTVDEATQSIKIRNTLSDYTTDPNGFENRTDSTLSFNSSTRVFTIAPASTDYEIWNQGQQYTISTSKTVTITNTTGIYLVYFDGSTLSVASGAEPTWASQTPVSYVYWNAATSEYLFTDERHGIRMDASTKEYLHETAAMAYADGFGASNYTITGTGANNADAQIDIANGVCYDQDIRVAITHSNSPTANTWQQDLQGPARIPVVYHSGATGAWRVDAQRDYPVKNGTSLVTYNLNTAGTWSTPDCTSTYFVAYWIVATNFLNTPIIAVMGQRQDNKLSDAIANNTWASLDLTNFPAEEFRPLYRVIVRTASGYANTPKAYFADIADFRLSAVSPAGAVSAVNAFTTVAVSGQTDIIADTATDTLTLVAGTNITLTTDPTTDSVTIAATGGGSGTVNSGSGGRLAWYATTGTAVSSNAYVLWDNVNQKLQVNSIESAEIGDLVNDRKAIFNSTMTGLVYDAGASYSSLAQIEVSSLVDIRPAVRVSTGTPNPIYLKSNLISIGGFAGAGANATLGTVGTTEDLIITTSDGVSRGNIKLEYGTNGNIIFDPAGTGLVKVNADLDLQTGILGTSTTDTDIYIEPNGTGRVVLAKQMSTEVPAGTAFLDNSGNATSYANNATVDFANFSGMIVVNRQDTNGNVALWILGSGGAVKLGDSSGSAVSGTFSHVSGIDGYRWTNDTGGTVTVAFAAVKTRDGA